MLSLVESYHPRFRRSWTMDPVKARRIIDAVLENIQTWQDQLEEIERHATPDNRRQCLHLLRSLEQGRITLERLARDAETD